MTVTSNPNRIDYFGKDIVIWLARRDGSYMHTFIDAKDYPLVKDFHWHADRSNKTYYAVTKVWVSGKRTSLGMHRLITGIKNADHEDHNGLNNRSSNLRPATPAEQAHNIQSGDSGYKGVSSDGKRYGARIRVNYKLIHLGTFDTVIEAARIYNEAALKYFGEFAVLNDLGEHELIMSSKP